MTRYRYLYLISLILLVSLVTSCEKETFTPTPVEGEEAEYTFRLSIGGIASKAMENTEENKIDEIDVLVFKENHLLYRSKAEQGSIEEDGGYTRKTFKVKLTTDNSLNNELVIIANARESIENAMIDNLISKPMDAVMEKIVFKIDNNANDDRWPARLNGDNSPYRPIPMWGKSKRTSISKDLENSLKDNPIALYRALARIDLINKAQTNFRLSHVHFYKYNRAGCVAPGASANWGEHYYTNQPRVTNVTLPQDPSTATGEYLTYPVSSGGTSGDIYVMEIDRAAQDDYENASCLILEGYYDGNTNPCFYRIDFEIVWYTDQSSTGIIIEAGLGETGQKRTFARMLRNHVYEITINSVSKAGAPSMGEALRNTDTQRTGMQVKAAVWTRKSIDVIF